MEHFTIAANAWIPKSLIAKGSTLNVEVLLDPPLGLWTILVKTDFQKSRASW